MVGLDERLPGTTVGIGTEAARNHCWASTQGARCHCLWWLHEGLRVMAQHWGCYGPDEGLPGITVGPAMEEPEITAGPNVVGLDDGLPGVTLHPAMIRLKLGLPARSHYSQGQHLGQPTRATVGLAVMGSGLAVVGLDEELPGDAIAPTAASDNTINNKHQRY